MRENRCLLVSRKRSLLEPWKHDLYAISASEAKLAEFDDAPHRQSEMSKIKVSPKELTLNKLFGV